MDEPFLVGVLVGFVLGAMIIGWLWNETIKDENDQKIKKNK
jgi:biotin transporter BioY